MTDSQSPPGLDLAAVGRFLGVDGLRGELLSGGRSNLTYRIWTDGSEWVLRRPPLGHVLATAHDMPREYRVMSALAGSDVPVPEMVTLCEDDSVNGAPFYVMEMVHGLIIRGEPPAGYADAPEQRVAMAEQVIDVLAALHRVDYLAVGLGEHGRPDGYLERQVRRWNKQWEGNKTRELTEVEDLARRLGEAIPASGRPAIVHGDYRLDNTMVSATEPGRILAVLDWEMSTVGDPLADVGLLMVYWDDAGATRFNPSGFPGREWATARYAAKSGIDVTHLGWYTAMGYYKLAVISEGIHARFLKGQTVGAGFEGIGAGVPVLAAQGLAALG